jgi:hypothetical protein
MNKNIRLVFEKWDGDKPLPNCSEFFGSDGFRYEDGFFDFYERYYYSLRKYERHSLPRTFHKILEVYENKDLNYYFVIKTALSINEMFKERKLFFSEEVLNCLRDCNNFTIVFLTEHESDDELGYVELKDYIAKNGLNDNQFMLLNNNGNFQNYNLKYNGNIRFNQLQLIPITSTSIFSDLKPPLIVEKTGKLFICHNKSSKPHRYATLALLHKKGLIDDVNWSLVTGQVRPSDDYVWIEEALSKDVVKSCEKEIKKLFSIKVKESDYEIDKKYFSENGEIIFDKNEFPELGDAAMESGGLLIPEDSFSYMNSYINIVTESQFRDDFNVIHVSEKSFRPFAYYNLPIIVATQNHIKYMKDKYGFDFYDDLINHDYDNEKYIGNRITMLIDEVIRLKNNKEDVIKFYKQNTHRLIKNQKIVSEIKNNTDDYEFFKTIMS